MKIDDMLTECAKVLLFSFARNRGEKKDYRSPLCCSGEPPRGDGKHRRRERAGKARDEKRKSGTNGK